MLLGPGYMVALTLEKDAAPLRVYVGRVEEADESGLRLALVDWILREFCGWDLFVPWDRVTSAMCSSGDAVENFLDSAATWQNNMKDLNGTTA